jgi:hypothetical protein
MMISFHSTLWRYLAIIIVAAAFSGICNSQPKVSIDKATVDLGIVYNGTVKKARVVIKNSGNDTLRILGVSTSCGCTTVRRPKDFLRSGESDAVEVEFNSTGFRGKIEKHIEILSNDPKTPRASVTLLCNVIEELQPVNNASVVWLGTVPIGKTIEQVVGLKNVSGKVITLLGFKSTSPDIVANFTSKTVMPADTIRFTIRVTSRRRDYVSELLLLETDSNRQSQVPIRITLLGVTPN